MTDKTKEARARAESMFKTPEQPAGGTAASADDQTVRDRTARLREQRLAKEAIDAKAAKIRAQRRLLR